MPSAMRSESHWDASPSCASARADQSLKYSTPRSRQRRRCSIRAVYRLGVAVCVAIGALLPPALGQADPWNQTVVDVDNAPESPQPREVNLIGVGSCLCDLREGACDTNCYCDSECPGELARCFFAILRRENVKIIVVLIALTTEHSLMHHGPSMQKPRAKCLDLLYLKAPRAPRWNTASTVRPWLTSTCPRTVASRLSRGTQRRLTCSLSCSASLRTTTPPWGTTSSTRAPQRCSPFAYQPWAP